MSRFSLPLLDPKRTEFGFGRTVCACPGCSRFCRTLPGYLIPADLERMQNHLTEGRDIFAWADEHLLASPGAVVLQNGKTICIPTLVPAHREDGACIFLTQDNLCAIHALAPFGCAFFDDHQSAEEADKRSSHGLQVILEAWRADTLYAQVWKNLHSRGLWALAPETARSEMDRDDRARACSEKDPQAPQDVTTLDFAELLRRLRLVEINTAPEDRATLEGRYGNVWDTRQLALEFEVFGFLAPFVVVRRRVDGTIGALEFQHQPRFYFNFKPDCACPLWF